MNKNTKNKNMKSPQSLEAVHTHTHTHTHTGIFKEIKKDKKLIELIFL